MHETVENMSDGLESVRRPWSKVHGSAVDASVLTKGISAKDVGGISCVMGRACFSDKCERGLRKQKEMCQLNACLSRCWVFYSLENDWHHC